MFMCLSVLNVYSYSQTEVLYVVSQQLVLLSQLHLLSVLVHGARKMLQMTQNNTNYRLSLVT